MKTLSLSIIAILAISVAGGEMAHADVTSGPVLFMKSNSTGQIYANFTFRVLDNHTWDITPGIFASTSDSSVPKDLAIVATPSLIVANKTSVPVTFTITAKNDIKGIYAMFLYFCGESPLAVGLNESELNPAILSQFFNAKYMCPMMSGSTPDMSITGYSGMISKTVSTVPSITNNVEIQDIQVQPSTIKVGDAFTVTATLVNNSTVPIILNTGMCSIKDTQASFFTVKFDDHAKIKAENINCAGVGWSQILNPGKEIVGTSPDYTLEYIATESGTANATVTFSYDVRNKTDPTQPSIEHTISKSLLFAISDNGTKTKTIPETILSPLKQFKSGIAAQDVTCNKGLQLVIKSDDNSPACVQSSTATRLVQLGWAKSQENTGAVVTLTEGQRDGPFLVQKIYQDHVQGLNFREYPVARDLGSQVTLRIGDVVSNGCTVELTLVKIGNNTATFLKKEYQNRPCPICLSENSMIDTPNGPVGIKDLKSGMAVFTQDVLGHRQSGIILKTGRTLVPQNHVMIHVVLNDKRELYASPNHPTADGRLFGDLLAGDTLDGTKIKSADQVPYNGTYTYDILPSGQTGFYWADGILVASTLK